MQRVHAADGDPPISCIIETGYQVHDGALSAARRPQQSYYRAWIRLQVYLLQSRCFVIIGEGNVVEYNLAIDAAHVLGIGLLYHGRLGIQNIE